MSMSISPNLTSINISQEEETKSSVDHSSAFFNSLLIKFEGQDSWMGSYKEAQAYQPHFKYLEEQCGICLEKFTPNEQVIVLPCTHGLHERCFKPWVKEECPYDKTPAKGITKVSGLGQVVLFPPKTRALGMWLSKYQDKANNELEKEFQKIANFEEFQKKMENPNSNFRIKFRVLEVIIQDILNAYDGALPRRDIPEHSQIIINMMIANKEFTFGTPEIQEKNLQKHMNLDIFKSVDLVRSSPEKVLPNLLVLCDLFSQVAEISVDRDGIERAFLYVQRILQDFLDLPEFKQLADKLEQRFLSHHFKEIRKLPTQVEKDSYISKIDKKALERLHRLTYGSRGPTGSLIKRHYDTYKENLDFNNKVKRVATDCLVFVGVIGLLISSVFFMKGFYEMDEQEQV